MGRSPKSKKCRVGFFVFLWLLKEKMEGEEASVPSHVVDSFCQRLADTCGDSAVLSEFYHQLVEIQLAAGPSADPQTLERLFALQDLYPWLAGDSGSPPSLAACSSPQLQIQSPPPELTVGSSSPDCSSQEEMEAIALSLTAATAAADSSTPAASVVKSSSSSSISSRSPLTSEGPQDCPICYEECPPAELRGFLGCSHRCCKDCMQSHLATFIENSEVSKIKCINPSCTTVPAEYEVENLVSPDLYDKYLQFILLESLKKETNIRWCPQKSCGHPIECDSGDKHIVCPSCHFSFCFECLQPYATDHFCKIEDKSDPNNPDEKGFRSWLNQKKNKVKPCPRCRSGIEKNSGRFELVSFSFSFSFFILIFHFQPRL